MDPGVAFLASFLRSGPNDGPPAPVDFDSTGGISRENTNNSDHWGDDEEPDPREGSPADLERRSTVPLLPRSLPLSPVVPPLTNIMEFCRELKRRKSFKPESEAELDTYASTSRAEEHMVMIFAGILEVRDLAKEIRQHDSWAIPDALSDNLRAYATAFLLCPTLSSYRGKVANKLLDALRELNLAHLPPVKETSQVKQVLAVIGQYLTHARNTIKTQLKASVAADSEDKVNLADLANAVIGKTGLKPTVQFYMRLAFLRWHIVNYPGVTDEWWGQVDETLMSWRVNLKTEALISGAFTDLFNQDKIKFGDPYASGRKVVDVRDLDNWQIVLQTHAKTVEAKVQKKRKVVPI